MARPAKLTLAIHQAIVSAVAVGVTFPKAADLAGISPSTAKEWLQRGEGRLPDRPPTHPYVSFAAAIKKAKAADERRRVKRITKAAQGGQVIAEKITTYPDGREVREVRYSAPNWTADAWYLERSDPKSWGRRERISVVDVNDLIKTKADELSLQYGFDSDELIAEAEALANGADPDA